ncbi:MAG: hypothetical protein ACRD0G_12275 [Acidimicrobiales bacterium]
MTDNPRTEVPLYAIGEIEVSRVTWQHPLPAHLGQHPPACDSLSHLRYRLAGTPDDPSHADAVVSLQPGYTGGASSFDTLARNLVLELAARGTTAEAWAMERRSHGLTDATGMRAAFAAKNHRLALDYYYRHQPIDGRWFDGWAPRSAQRFLTELGIAQTVLDWHFVLTHELPDRAARAAKLFIGGHSLGGPLSSFYCQWDFDGDRTSSGGPGYAQIAGVVGLDGPIGADPFNLRQRPVVGPLVRFAGRASRPAVLGLLRAGVVPPSQNGNRIRLGDVGLAVTIAAIAARFEPTAESDLPAALPRSSLLTLALGVLFSGRGVAPFRRWRLTNQAVLGSLFGRISQPSSLANDLGGYDGPVASKRPSVAALTRLPFLGEFIGGVVTGARLVRPADPVGRVTGWQCNGAMCDIDDVALAWGNGEFSYMNCYETLRIGLDLFYAGCGIHTGELAALEHGNFETAVPTTVVIGDIWRPFQRRGVGHAPTAVYAGGYSHQDILAAAHRRNGGQPEIVTTTVADFVERAATSPAQPVRGERPA